tara:strand:+ start:306 stop:914 length:609 start_codon:yes stop_codon:yes gene_type:complete
MIGVISGVASLAGGIMGASSARKQAKRARQIGEYNAKVAMIQAEAEQASIDFQSKRLVKQQREIKAQQRMSIASRGGLEAGTDLLSLIESAKNMQLDLLELERQQDIAQISGETQAQQARMGAEAQAQAYKAQGRQAMLGGVLGAAQAFAPMLSKPTSGSINMGSMASTQNLQMTSKYGSTIGNLMPNAYSSYAPKPFSFGG